MGYRWRIDVLLIVCLMMCGCSTSRHSLNQADVTKESGKDASAHRHENQNEYVEVIVCKNDRIESDIVGCSRNGEGSRIVIYGDILASNKVYQAGIVIVDGITGKILYSGCDQENLHQTSEVLISCPNSVVSPGMINAHDHITYSNAQPAVWGEERFEHRHDWRKGLHGHTQIAGPSTSHSSVVELRQLMGGTTAVFGSGKASGLIRNLDEETIGGVQSIYQTFPLGDSQSPDYPDNTCSFSYDESVRNYDESCPYGPHIGEGINQAAHNELVCLSGENGGPDIFKPNLAVIHGVAASPDMVEKMALHNVKMVWSPRTNISLYGDTAPITVYDNFGITIGLGTDWIYSGSANLLRELKCVDYLNQNYYHHHFSDYEIWRMPTMGSALAMGVSQFLGRIEKGYYADIVIYKKKSGDSAYRSVIEAENKDVQLVMINGKMLYGDDNLIPAGESINVCGEIKKYDALAAGTKSLEDISKNAAYPLFFCDTPKNEPSCVPQRVRDADTVQLSTSQYAAISDNDRDGDGISDAIDNCPDMFNPVRPQDISRVQSDIDGDGIGDVCDLYPLCRENDSTCRVYTRDHDGDGIMDYVDNCPDITNSDQMDTDEDNIGDVCDLCDERYDRDGDGIADNCDRCPDNRINEDGYGCELELTSLSSLRQSVLEGRFESHKAKVKGTVTAVGSRGFFIQDELAGLYIFETPSDLSVINDVDNGGIREKYDVTVIGNLVSYYGLIELKEAQSVVLNHVSGQIADPKTITGDFTTKDADDKVSKNILDSTLVKVNHLTIQSFVKSKKNNYAIAVDERGNKVYVDDFLMGDEALFNALKEGKVYDITGVLVYDYSMSKLAPRRPEDILLK